MDAAEFDKFAEEYRSLHAQSIKASGEAPEFFAAYKVRDVAERFAHTLPAAARILDFGAGVGTSLPYFRADFPTAELTCLDVSTKSLAIAEARFPNEAAFVAFDGQTLPFESAGFDLAFAACVFHHIDHDEHPRLIAELFRVLAPGGRLVIFEHNPLNPLTVQAVNQCAFDENAELLRAGKLKAVFARAGFEENTTVFRIFFPKALAGLRWTERYLAWLPIGAQYFVTGTKPRAG